MAIEDSERVAEGERQLTLRRHEPTDFFVGVTVVGALIAAAAGAVLAVLFLVGTFVALLGLRRLELPTTFELAVAVGIVLQGWGNALLLFERIAWYDKAVHFLTPLLMVPALYIVLARVGALASPWRSDLRNATLGVFTVTLALGVASAAIWELVEGSSDRLLGTGLAHGYFETIDDLYSSLLGSLSGAALLAWLAATGRDLTDERSEALLDSRG